MSLSKPPNYGDLLLDLKEKKIFPKNHDYKDHVSAWINENIFQHHIVPQEVHESVAKFSASFKERAKVKWNANNNSITWGRSSQLDQWLSIEIPTFYDLSSCNCLTCTVTDEAEDVEMADLEEKEKRKQYKKIAEASLKLRNSGISEDVVFREAVILQAAKLILYDRGS